MKTEILM